MAGLQYVSSFSVVVASLNYKLLGSDRPLPKPQRRGAIIILGMLALARRSVVTERVDTLLKVGLGPLGKVSSLCPSLCF